LGVLIGLSARTKSPAKSLPSSPVELTPLATALIGSVWDCASSSEIVLLKPNWYSPLTTAGTIAAPPSACFSVRSMSRSEKKPLSRPR